MRTHVGLPRHLRVGVRHPRDSKVEDLRLTFGVHQNVAGLQIAMNQPALMCMIDGIADLRHELQARSQVELPLLDEITQGKARNKLHCEVRLRAEAGIRSPGFIDLGNPGMLQAAERVGFLLEATHQLGVHKPRPDDFEGNYSVRVFLLGQIDTAHAAFAKQAKDAIVADGFRIPPGCGSLCFRNIGHARAGRHRLRSNRAIPRLRP